MLGILYLSEPYCPHYLYGRKKAYKAFFIKWLETTFKINKEYKERFLLFHEKNLRPKIG
jgi:hypothetical protein